MGLEELTISEGIFRRDFLMQFGNGMAKATEY